MGTSNVGTAKVIIIFHSKAKGLRTISTERKIMGLSASEGRQSNIKIRNIKISVEFDLGHPNLTWDIQI